MPNLVSNSKVHLNTSWFNSSRGCPLILPEAQGKFWYGLLPHCKCWLLVERKSWSARRRCRRCWCRRICTKSEYSWVIWKAEISITTSKPEYRTWEDGVEAEQVRKLKFEVILSSKTLMFFLIIFKDYSFYRLLKITMLGGREVHQKCQITTGTVDWMNPFTQIEEFLK